MGNTSARGRYTRVDAANGRRPESGLRPGARVVLAVPSQRLWRPLRNTLRHCAAIPRAFRASPDMRTGADRPWQGQITVASLSQMRMRHVYFVEFAGDGSHVEVGEAERA